MSKGNSKSINMELLSALKDTLSCLEGWVEIAEEEDLREYDAEAIRKAKAAIDKAEGALRKA